MKAICILRLILFTVFLYGNSGLKSDIVIFGHNYTGDLKDGKRDGIGKYNYPNGDTYEGMWVNNIKEGEGTLTYNNDRYTYIGTFKNDLFNGWGTLYIIGGEKYEGYWKDGRMDGEGKYFYPFGNTYVGNWKNGKKEGRRNIYLYFWR